MSIDNSLQVVCAALLTNSNCGVRWPFGVDRAEGCVRLLGLRPEDYYTAPRGKVGGGVPLGKDANRRLTAVDAAVGAAAAGLRTLGTPPTAIELASAGFGRGETPALRGEGSGGWEDLVRAVAHDAAGLSAALRLAAAAGVYPVPARGGLPPQEFVDVQPTTNGEARRWSF